MNGRGIYAWIVVGLLIALSVASFCVDSARAHDCSYCFGNFCYEAGPCCSWYPHLRTYSMPRNLGLGGCGGGGCYYSASREERFDATCPSGIDGCCGWPYSPDVAHYFEPAELERLGEVPNDMISSGVIKTQ